MTVAAVVTAGRKAAEARMLDTCAIKYETGLTTQDETTGAQVPILATRFSTRCRVKSEGLVVRESDAGGRTVVEVVRVLNIPAGSPVVQPGDVAVMTSVHATSDPTLAGATLRLSGPAPGSQTTARRLQVSEVVA